MLNKKALAASVSAPANEYVEDVFSTYIYKGTGSSQTITNGIDLAGKGGLVWLKNRDTAVSNYLFDTARGMSFSVKSPNLISNTDGAESETLLNYIKADATGFSLGTSATGSAVNQTDSNYVSWAFRKAKKFFDIVTYTGNGSNRTIAHNLGSAPGMIIIKRTDAVESWFVYHTSLGAGSYISLNNTGIAESSNAFWNNTDPTSSVFSLGTSDQVNINNGTFVAYLFAHNAGGFGEDGNENIVSCGSFTTNGSGQVTVDLGYEPQFVMYKTFGTTGDWIMVDNIRGLNVEGNNQPNLRANLNAVESAGGYNAYPSATGFRVQSDASQSHIYLAIRRSNKPPTSGSQVFTPTVYTGTNADNRLIDTGILTDMVMLKERNDTVAGMIFGTRLTRNNNLRTGSTAAQSGDADTLMTPTVGYGGCFSAMNGVGVGNDATLKVNIDTTSNNHVAWAFKRAKKFFDVVCYIGDGVAGRTVTHNLGAVPELIIVRRISSIDNFLVYTATTGNQAILRLDTNGAQSTGVDRWNNTTPTSTVFTVSDNSSVNASSATYLALLFTSLNGISKVGSYTGNGTSQTINCGFSAGARFVLIKRYDNSGDWCAFDTARGIVSGNDPLIELNVAAGEITNEDAVDADNSGFIVNETTQALNTNNATYIYLAIA